jgi:predicted glycosyltransferase
MEWEQMLRAQALARLGMVDLLDPEALGPERLAERIRAALARPAAGPKNPVDLGGIESASDTILSLANGEPGGIRGRR